MTTPQPTAQRRRVEALNTTVLTWADTHDIPITTAQAGQLAAELALLLPRVRLRPAPIRKPGCTPADARRIAARLEATMQPTKELRR